MSLFNMPRRGVLGLAGSLAAILAMPRSATAAAKVPAYGTPEGKLRALIMMRGALDDRLVIHWLRSQYFGLVDGEITPICGVVNATFSRYRPHHDGGYIAARGEVTHYTDFATGEVVTAIPNPYTGNPMQPQARSMPPSPVRIQADSTIYIAEGAGLLFKNAIEDVEIIGDELIMRERNTSTLVVPGRKPSMYNELLTYRAKASDIANTDMKRVPCNTSVSTTLSWRPWMGMGDQPGHVLAIGTGSFVTTVDELPLSWLRATAVTHPALLKNPLSYLDPIWETMA